MKRRTFIAVVAAVLILLAAGTAFATGQIARNKAITADNAANFALVDAGVLPEEAEITEIEFNFDHGTFVYEVEFYANETKYEYKVDSVSGAILEKTTEAAPGHVQAQTQVKPAGQSSGKPASATTTAGTIGVDKAKEIAFADAGVKENQVNISKAKIDRDNGKLVYEIEFQLSGRAEYEYEIDAVTGEILEKGYEVISKPATAAQKPATSQNPAATGSTASSGNQANTNSGKPANTNTNTSSNTNTGKPANTNTNTGSNTNTKTNTNTNTNTGKPAQTSEQKPATPQPIGAEKAVAIAIQRAGVSVASVSNITVKYDASDREYDVEFYSGNNKYDVDVDAYTGAVRDYECKAVASKPAATQPTDIGIENAKAIALKAAGLRADQVTFTKAKLDREDGKLVYDIEFTANGMEYEVEINSTSGQIIDYDVEHID